MKRMTTLLLLGASLTVCGGCDGGPSGDDGRVSPGWADKSEAIATVQQTRQVEAALANGDAGKIVNQVGWLIGSASLIVFPPTSAATSALDSPPSGAQPAAPGSAACDARGCVFAGYFHLEPNGAPEIADGTIAIANLDSGARTVMLDLTLTRPEPSTDPIHLTATWTRTASGLDGSLRSVFEIPSHDDHVVTFDGVTFAGDEVTGGSLYAKWVSAQFGAYDATVSFP